MPQKQVIDVLNRNFVCVELDFTGGVPENLPAVLRRMRTYWEESPWSRVSFSTEFVLDPECRYFLTAGPHKYAASKQGTGVDQVRRVATDFQRSLEAAAERFVRIRSHERGSIAERQEIRRAAAEVDEELRERRRWLVDVDLATKYVLETLWRLDGDRREKKLLTVLSNEQAWVRRTSAEAIGRYVARSSEEFRASSRASFLGELVAPLVQDSDPAVRSAAAVALRQIKGPSRSVAAARRKHSISGHHRLSN